MMRSHRQSPTAKTQSPASRPRIKALTDVEQILGPSAPTALSTSRRSSFSDEGGCRGRQQVQGQAGEEAPGDVGPREKKAGIAIINETTLRTS